MQSPPAAATNDRKIHWNGHFASGVAWSPTVSADEDGDRSRSTPSTPIARKASIASYDSGIGSPWSLKQVLRIGTRASAWFASTRSCTDPDRFPATNRRNSTVHLRSRHHCSTADFGAQERSPELVVTHVVSDDALAERDRQHITQRPRANQPHLLHRPDELSAGCRNGQLGGRSR
jgi:hypothetical protein